MKGMMTMYTEDDTMTPRERISDDMLRRMLDGNRQNSEPITRAEKPNTNKLTWGLAEYPLAMVYAPLQVFRNLYDQDTALKKGTLFDELYLPFMGESVANKGGSCRG